MRLPAWLQGLSQPGGYAAVAAAAWLLAKYTPPLSAIVRALKRPAILHKRQSGSITTPGGELDSLVDADFTPPLPEPVVQVLTRCCLCFLATSSGDSPHLSLMRFSYSRSLAAQRPGAEVLIVSTRRSTKKYATLCANRNVALLVHDFAGENESDLLNYTALEGRPRHSITLSGVVREESGEMAERYRAIHLEKNQAYAQFIVGDDIAILTVEIETARVCDVNDRVSHFERQQRGSAVWVQTDL